MHFLPILNHYNLLEVIIALGAIWIIFILITKFKQNKTKPYNSPFSEFVRNASEEEKTKVFTLAIENSIKMQNETLNKAKEKNETS